MKLELETIGNSTGLILPRDLLARLGLKQGNAVLLTDGQITLAISAHDPHHEEVMRIGRDVFRECRETFKALAK